MRGLGNIRRAGLAMAFVLALARCGGEATSSTCEGTPPHRCASFCGSDALVAEVCVEGQWRCPAGSVTASDCPAGTCFGFSICCGPNGDTTPKTCPVSEELLSPASGWCPDGYWDCQLVDAGFGAGGSAGNSGGSGGTSGSGGSPPDAQDLIAECLSDKGQSCPFCCGKYNYSEMQAYGATLQPCVCAPAGPCASSCADNGFCSDPKMGPSSTCEPCLLAQRQPGAACAASVANCAASATCAPYLDCLAWCESL